MSMHQISTNQRILKSMVAGLLCFVTLSFLGCQATVTGEKLQARGGLIYKMNTNKLFTGKIENNSYSTGVKKGLFHGKYVSYFDNGQINTITYFKNGMSVGKCTVYYHDGKLLSESTFKKNMLEGPMKIYHNNGQLYTDSNYKNDKLNGEQRLYAEDGSLKLKAVFSMDAISGPIEAYLDKILVYKRTFDNTGVTIECIYPNGTPTYLAHYKNNSGINSYIETINRRIEQEENPNSILMTIENDVCRGGARYSTLESSTQLYGEFIQYHQNGKVELKGMRKDGKWDGVYEKYSSDGVLLERLNYSAGVLQGISELYYEDTGSLYVKATMNNDEKNGLFEQYYPNGKLQYSVNHINNNQYNGKCEQFDENGVPLISYTHMDGMFQGDYVLYHPNGTPRLIATFLEGNVEKKQYFDESGAPLSDQNQYEHFRAALFYGLETISPADEYRIF
ncbi:MAG TPA: hypothetical protein DC057_05440 [Spirochaetia bacterium]|nr:hypothetical protein [Spirochaetia bacterium]